MLVQEVRGKFAGGRIKLDSQGRLEDIIEGVHNRSVSLMNTALYVLTGDFFEYDLVKLKDKKEYGLPQTMVNMAREHPVNIEKAECWIQVTDLASLKRAEKVLKNSARL